MERTRLKEFRQVRWGAVKLHWTGKDVAEYERWRGKPVFGSCNQGAPEWLVVVAIILVLTAIAIPVIRHVRIDAQRAVELNAQQSQLTDRAQ